MVKNAATEVRLGFVRKVYGILSVQLLLTVAIAAPLQTVSMTWIKQHAWLLYISLGVMLATFCSMLCCHTVLREYPKNYIFMAVLTSAMGVLVGFTSAMYTWQSVCMSAAITVLIFLGMTAYAWTSKRDFTGYGPYLFAAGLTIMAFGFVLSILGMCGVNIKWGMIFYDIVSVLLFTFYIVYDTQLILGEYGGHSQQFGIDDYCFAALSLYLDIINLFLHLLSLLGDRK
eukprot:CAMPEP_0170614742 /NCGR_PEP_ID=MMETSP0224-20130122/24965_1 /TAXON_ID=285029 /ORGANISM="Togula jolla, Strain CCCM 725" /LENGTH=228 /DNA_ID=CAMNT_0010940425 /DNA_START=37 /DNA_END=723 /DNA_ORIENTATION=+